MIVMYQSSGLKNKVCVFYINFDSFLDLAFGSIVTLKNTRAGGALLHSHTHLYPKEHPPEQQQVNMFLLSFPLTLYTHLCDTLYVRVPAVTGPLKVSTSGSHCIRDLHSLGWYSSMGPSPVLTETNRCLDL